MRGVRERRDGRRETRDGRRETGEEKSVWEKETSDEAYYAVRVILIFLFELSSSVCVVDSPASRGRLLPKTLQRLPAPDLGCFTAVGDLEDRDLDFGIQTIKY